MKYGLRAIEKACSDFDMPLKYGLASRFLQIISDIEEEKAHIKNMLQFIVGQNTETKEFTFACIKDAHHRIATLQGELYAIKTYSPSNRKSDISAEMIDRAREYPLGEFLEVRRNMALCVNHVERTPSMNTKNNFAYCHSCGWSGDAIAVYQKIHGCNFVEAVKALQ